MESNPENIFSVQRFSIEYQLLVFPKKYRFFLEIPPAPIEHCVVKFA